MTRGTWIPHAHIPLIQHTLYLIDTEREREREREREIVLLAFSFVITLYLVVKNFIIRKLGPLESKFLEENPRPWCAEGRAEGRAEDRTKRSHSRSLKNFKS